MKLLTAFTGLVVALFCTLAPLQAQTATEAPVYNQAAVDALRNRIYAMDIPAVEAIFRAVRSDSRQALADQRDLLAVFTELHPAVDAFTTRWLAASPQSAPAMTARAFYLNALGWALRGGGPANTVSEAARAAFQEAHSTGLTLALAARDAAPEMVGASDAILLMSYTTGRQDMIIPEVARIMALSPNRPTMIKAAQGLAPKWGGSLSDIVGLCNLHAKKVTSQPGYDAQVCMIEGVLKGGPLPGGLLAGTRAALAANDSPLLDYLRGDAAVVAGDTPSARLAALDAIMARRPLTIFEAQVHDQDNAQLSVLAGVTRPPEYPAAVARNTADARLWADRMPGSVDALENYGQAMALDQSINATPFDLPDLQRRYVDLLKIAPFSVDVWADLAMIRMHAAPNLLDGIEAAEPLFVNAVVYSNHDPRQLWHALSPKLAEVLQAMNNGTPPSDTARFHRVVQCPMVRQLRLALAMCRASGKDFEDCSGGNSYGSEQMDAFIRDIAYAGACQPETSAPLDSLYYTLQEIAPITP